MSMKGETKNKRRKKMADSVYREYRDSREGFIGGYYPTEQDYEEWEDYLDLQDEDEAF